MPLLLCAAAAHAQPARRPEPLLPADRLVAWLEDVQRHTPGAADGAALEVANWSRSDLEILAGDIRKVSAFYYRFRNDRGRSLRIYDRTFSLDQLEKLFLGNATLLRGALLHSDIAMYVVDDLSVRSGGEQDITFAVDDGRGQGTRRMTVHWRIGRLVLDAVAPSPKDNALALLWYRASAAYLLRQGHFAEVHVHLDIARQLFPTSADVFLDSAYLREKFASPEIQAAVQDLKSRGTTLNVDSDRTELARAEGFFRQVLSLDPARVEARVRLGHVLGELGRHQEAAAELRQAIAAGPKGALRYFAELFVGREEELLGDRDAARAHFQEAAIRFPDAQSPHLALSRLARQSGDRAAALRALEHVTSLPADESYRADPWWVYFMYHADDVDELIDQARARAVESVQ